MDEQSHQHPPVGTQSTGFDVIARTGNRGKRAIVATASYGNGSKP
jgi:hypothetical protein